MSRAADSRIVTTDAEIDAAIARANAEPTRAAVTVAYDREGDRVLLTFEDGTLLGLPRWRLQGLENASAEDLEDVELLAPGTAAYWPRLDVGHDIPGLLDGVFGTRRWMAELGKRGGASRSAKKAEAAQNNGKRGGRPRILTQKGTAQTRPSAAQKNKG